MNKDLLDSKRHDLQVKTNEAANLIVVLMNGAPNNRPKMINKVKVRLREIQEVSEQLYTLLSG